MVDLSYTKHRGFKCYLPKYKFRYYNNNSEMFLRVCKRKYAGLINLVVIYTHLIWNIFVAI